MNPDFGLFRSGPDLSLPKLQAHPNTPFTLNTLSTSILLVALLAVGCSDSPATSTPGPDAKSLTKAAMGGDSDAMKKLEEQTAQVAAEVKAEIEVKASAGDEKALVSSAWLNGGEKAILELIEADNSQALFELGSRYNSQGGVKESQGRDWLIKAADLGHAQAGFLVGKHSLHGLTGFAKDAVVGRDYLERSAKGGHAEAAFALGVALRYGLGLPEDKAVALEYYQQADKGGFNGAADELRSLTKELGGQ